MSVKECWRHRRKSQEGRRKKWTMKSIKVGQLQIDRKKKKVSTKELKEQDLSPNGRCANIERIVRQARSEKCKNMFQIFSRQRSKRDPCRQCGEMGGAFENVDSSGEGMPGTQGSN